MMGDNENECNVDNEQEDNKEDDNEDEEDDENFRRIYNVLV